MWRPTPPGGPSPKCSSAARTRSWRAAPPEFGTISDFRPRQGVLSPRRGDWYLLLDRQGGPPPHAGAMTTNTANQLEAGDNLVAPVRVGEVVADKYLIERTLGVGGMGVVVAARDQVLDRRVAIQFL